MILSRKGCMNKLHQQKAPDFPGLSYVLTIGNE
nr:MAG TPA: hypothetical protein [Caudoviricetes sp.]